MLQKRQLSAAAAIPTDAFTSPTRADTSAAYSVVSADSENLVTQGVEVLRFFSYIRYVHG